MNSERMRRVNDHALGDGQPAMRVFLGTVTREGGEVLTVAMEAGDATTALVKAFRWGCVRFADLTGVAVEDVAAPFAVDIEGRDLRGIEAQMVRAKGRDVHMVGVRGGRV